MRYFRPRLVLLCLAVCLVQLFLAFPASSEIVDRIVAEVNNDIITMSELDQASKLMQSQAGIKPKSKEGKAFKREMLDALIDRKLARAEAKRRGITVSDKELDKAVEEFKKRNNIPDDAALDQALAKNGITRKEMRQQISDQIKQERLQAIVVGAKAVNVPEAEVRRYYDAQLKGGGGKQVHIQMLSLPYPPGATEGQKEETQKKAETVLKEHRQGESLAEIQRKHALTGQDLGFIREADLNPQLAEIIKKLRPGEVAPIRTPQGFQLVVLAGRRTAQARSYEEVAPQIRLILSRQGTQKEFFEWVKTLRKKAHIKIML
jgi:peptidyl-prolyl cis-trans isomerase SurA